MFLCVVVLLLFSSLFPCSVLGDSPASKQYWKLRNELIEADRQRHFGSELELNEVEQQADDVLQMMKQQEIHRTAGKFPPEFNFYQMKSTIEESQLLSIMNTLPKGGILHGHMEAMHDMHFYVNLSKEPNFFINKKTFAMQMAPQSPGEDWLNGTYARENLFPGGADEFETHMYSLLTMSDGPEMSGDGEHAWVKFQSVFILIGGLINYLPVRERYMYQTFQNLVNDKVFYWEVRLLPGGVFDFDHVLSLEEELEAYLSLLKKFNKEVERDFMFKIIFTTSRSFEKEVVHNLMSETLRLRQKYPDFLVGFDLVGEEDTGHNTFYYLEEIIDVQESASTLKHGLPLFLHDGETAKNGNYNVFEAVVLGAKRIAHGYNIFRYPLLVDIIKSKNITLEVCPISNQVLRLVDDLRNHPANSYLAEGLSITINSDDPGLLGYSGVYYDYYMAVMAWDLDLKMLKRLTRNSLISSSLKGSELDHLLAVHQSYWDAFVLYLASLDKPFNQ